MKVQNMAQLIGNTPHLRLSNLFPKAEVWMKLERFNPGGSIKDRIALAMVEDAEQSGKLSKGQLIVEPTSGNTGIGLALVAAVKGYKLTITMPESMSVERRRQMTALGAEIVLTPREKGMKGAIEKAQEIVAEHNAWMPMQFDNPVNPEIHFQTTAREILTDFPEGFDYLITGVGTGGHISGVGKALKQHWPELKIIAVEPVDSAVISGAAPGPHSLQGIGAGFIPRNLDVSILDCSIGVSKEEAFRFTQQLASKEALFAGISTGATAAAVYQLREEISGKRVLSFNYDTGERYLSVDDLF